MSVSLSRRVYLKFARNATIFRHFLAHLSYNLAQELRHLTKKGDGKRKKSSLQCYAILCERTDSPKALASVAGYMENGKFHPINDIICHSAFAADLGVTFIIGEQERRTLSQDGRRHLELIPP
jgi:hypothetical protein